MTPHGDTFTQLRELLDHLRQVHHDASVYCRRARESSDQRLNLLAQFFEQRQKSLAAILMAGIPVAFFLSLIGGFFLAERALSPVKAITRKAKQITAESLSERLPVQNPHDEIGHLTAVFNETLARLENSFEQLRRFTADASHELRTPLTSIRSVGEVALQKPMDKKSSQEAIGSMLEETERLTRLVDNLLILARGDAKKAKIALPDSKKVA